MKIFDRNLTVYLRRIPDIPRYAFYFLKCFVLFKNPVKFLLAYLTRRTLKEGIIYLRNGMSIHLTNHPHDPITVFVIFVRGDYGKLHTGNTVIDIGANNGVFALYAINQGASSVLAYEPNTIAFQCLQKNITANQLQNRVTAFQLAVSSTAGQSVKFPVSASVYNSILFDDSKEDFEFVQTTSLPNICRPLSSIDVLKLDCEGAEYDILFSSGKSEFEKIHEIKLEYHKGQLTELQGHMKSFGFEVTLLKPDSSTYGNIWLKRSGS
jgi:FkbM family methyltransferase